MNLYGNIKKIVWSGLLAVALGGVTASQYMANQLNYHKALNGHITEQIYWPWAWGLWRGQLSNYPVVIRQGDQIFFGVAWVVLMLCAFAQLKRRAKPDKRLYGTAAWAPRDQVLKSNLLKGKGVFVGAWKDPKFNKIRYLRHDGPEHILAFAPTRSGKGVGLVLPTLLTWSESVVVYDPKGEAYALTSGWRKTQGNKVWRFDPSSDTNSCSFNPLDEVRIGSAFEVADAQNIASMIVDPDGKGLIDHWAKTSWSLLTACIIHCVNAKEYDHPSISDIALLIADPDRAITEVLEDLLNYPHRADGSTHPVVEQEARAMANKDPRELSSVVSTALSFLTLYRDPVVAKNTTTSDFSIDDLMNAEQPASVYLVISPAHADRLRPLIRLIISQMVSRLTETMEFSEGRSVAGYKHRLLFMLDEFASLKKIAAIEQSLAFAAGYGIKYYLIIQDLQQLNAAYGRDETILANAHVRIAFAPNKLETADLLSKMTGMSTVIKESTTFSGKRMGSLGNASVSQQEVSRALMTPDEVMRLPGPKKDGRGHITAPGDMLIFIAGQLPIYGKQVLYFKDKTLLERAKMSPAQLVA